MAVGFYRVNAELNNREDREAKSSGPQMVDAAQHCGMGPSSAVVNSSSIVQDRGAVQTHSDSYGVAPQHLAPFCIQQCAVGLEGEDDPNLGTQSLRRLLTPPVDSVMTGLTRFAPVEDQLHTVLRRKLAMASNPLKRRLEDGVAHDARRSVSGLVGLVIDVTVGAIQIAAIGCLDDDLGQWPNMFVGPVHLQYRQRSVVSEALSI